MIFDVFALMCVIVGVGCVYQVYKMATERWEDDSKCGK